MISQCSVKSGPGYVLGFHCVFFLDLRPQNALFVAGRLQSLVSLDLTWNGDLHDCVGRPVGHAEDVDGEVYPPVLVVAVGEVVLRMLPEGRVDVSAQLHVL